LDSFQEQREFFSKLEASTKDYQVALKNKFNDLKEQDEAFELNRLEKALKECVSESEITDTFLRFDKLKDSSKAADMVKNKADSLPKKLKTELVNNLPDNIKISGEQIANQALQEIGK